MVYTPPVSGWGVSPIQCSVPTSRTGGEGDRGQRGGRKRLRTVLSEQALSARGRRAPETAPATRAGAMSWREATMEEPKETRMDRIVTRAAPCLYALLRLIG